MGQRRGLASTDVIKLNKMYKCNVQNPKPPARPQPGHNNVGVNQGNGFGGGANPNWGFYPLQAVSFLGQLVSYFFQRNPRQSDGYESNPRNNGYGFTGRNNGYEFNGQNGRYRSNGPYGGYRFQK